MEYKDYFGYSNFTKLEKKEALGVMKQMVAEKKVSILRLQLTEQYLQKEVVGKNNEQLLRNLGEIQGGIHGESRFLAVIEGAISDLEKEK